VGILKYCLEEIAEFLGKNLTAVKGYLKRGQDLREKMERLILFFAGGGKNLNN